MKVQKTPVLSNLTDVAYQSALSGERSMAIAKWVVENRPTFLDKIESEDMDMLTKGFALRWQELNPAKRFDSNSWVPSESGDVQVTLAYCLSYSQQAFGQLKNESPAQHGVIKKIRDQFNKYKSNSLSDLKRHVRKAMSVDEPKTRNQAKPWAEWMDDIFADAKKRCKTAQARGDASAPDEVKLRQAIDAFFAKLS